MAVGGTLTVAGVAAVAVAPSTAGNVLTSNGTTWTSTAPVASGVSSLIQGNGITVSSSTGAVTVSQDIYTGTTAANTSFPIGSCVIGYTTSNLASFLTLNASYVLYVQTSTGGYSIGSGTTALTGTWRLRGMTLGTTSAYSCCGVQSLTTALLQRVA